MLTKSRSGSVTIFAMLFFITLIGMIFIFIDASKKIAVDSSAQSLCSLWGDSILGEYDQNLQKRYNLFGFYGMPSDVTEKVKNFADYSFHEKRYISWGDITCQLYDYSLVNIDIFRKQIGDVGKLLLAEKVLKEPKEITPITESQTNAIQNESILSGLPSAGSPKSTTVGSIIELLKDAASAKKLAERGGNTLLQEEYIFMYYKDSLNDRKLGKTFFRGEIEYILCGKHSDDGNIQSIRNKIIAGREAMNFVYLNKDPVTSSAAMAAAQILTPGPAAIATQKGLLAAWALAESVNDYRLLVNGHKIPLMKGEDTWAIDLDAILHPQENGYVYTGIDKGETYEDYLRILLCTMDENVRLLRMMDIIQINMKFFYYQNFQLKDYNGGLRFSMKVNGKDHETVKKY